jgi:hypothetical protein
MSRCQPTFFASQSQRNSAGLQVALSLTRSAQSKEVERSRLLLLRPVENLLRCHRHDLRVSRHEVTTLDQLYKFQLDLTRDELANAPVLLDISPMSENPAPTRRVGSALL